MEGVFDDCVWTFGKTLFIDLMVLPSASIGSLVSHATLYAPSSRFLLTGEWYLFVLFWGVLGLGFVFRFSFFVFFSFLFLFILFGE